MKFSWIVILIFTVGLSSCSSDGGEEYPYDLKTVLKDPKVRDAVMKAGTESKENAKTNAEPWKRGACTLEDIYRAASWNSRNQPFTERSHIRWRKGQQLLNDAQLCAGGITLLEWCHKSEQIGKLKDQYFELKASNGSWSESYEEYLEDSLKWKSACAEYRTGHIFDHESGSYRARTEQDYYDLKLLLEDPNELHP